MKALDIYEAKEQISGIVQQLLSSGLQVTAEQCGLDERCGDLYVSAPDAEAGWIAIDSYDKKSFDYYGGLEYTNGPSFIADGFCFYLADDEDRIQGILEIVHEEDGTT